MISRFFIALFFLIIVSSGCEKDIDLKNTPAFVSRLFIAGFLSPSDTISLISVSANQHLYGDLDKINRTGKLTASISDGNKEIMLSIAEDYMYFRSEQMNILPGNTYRLKVKSDNGMDATAECTIPVPGELKASLDTFSIYKEVNGYEFLQFKTMFHLTNQSDTEYFYRIIAKTTSFKKYSSNETSSVYDNTIWMKKQLYTYKEADTENTLNIPFELNYDSHYYDSIFLKVYVIKSEKSYYLYHKSLEDYNDGENPFAEPTPVYSNVEGGLGIFTSYTMDSLVYRLK